MPRTVKVVITPNVDETERDQNVEDLVQQFKQFYCQTREESLKKLAVTLEDQAFRHAETRYQYSYNLTSLLSEELEKATRLQAEIYASPAEGQSFGFGTRPPLFSETKDAQEEEKLFCGDAGEEWGNVNNDRSAKDKKARQQMARQKIMTRRRKRAQTAGKTDQLPQMQARLSTVEEPLQLEHESGVEFVPDLQSENDSGEVKSSQTGGLDAVPDVTEWIDELCKGKGDLSMLGSSFLEELSDGTFGIDEECNDIETCFSSSESEVSACKRRRIAEKSSE